MIDKHKWISDYAYYLSEHRKRLGCPESDLNNWLDAEWEWEEHQKHIREFRRSYDIETTGVYY